MNCVTSLFCKASDSNSKIIDFYLRGPVQENDVIDWGISLFFLVPPEEFSILLQSIHHHHHHHHHHHYDYHVHEGLGVFSVPWSSKWSWSLHLFLGLPMFIRLFNLYCNACFGILFVSILCTCCSHFSWYCFISFTIFCVPVSSLIH
jgi:hypothetical protein